MFTLRKRWGGKDLEDFVLEAISDHPLYGYADVALSWYDDRGSPVEGHFRAKQEIDVDAEQLEGLVQNKEKNLVDPSG